MYYGFSSISQISIRPLPSWIHSTFLYAKGETGSMVLQKQTLAAVDMMAKLSLMPLEQSFSICNPISISGWRNALI